MVALCVWRIDGAIWLRNVVDKLAVKHHVEAYEVEEALNNRPKILFVEKGDRPGEDVYMALGKTFAGRGVNSRVLPSEVAQYSQVLRWLSDV